MTTVKKDKQWKQGNTGSKAGNKVIKEKGSVVCSEAGAVAVAWNNHDNCKINNISMFLFIFSVFASQEAEHF